MYMAVHVHNLNIHFYNNNFFILMVLCLFDSWAALGAE